MFARTLAVHSVADMKASACDSVRWDQMSTPRGACLPCAQAVHSGADLNASAKTAAGALPGAVKGFLGYVQAHQGDHIILPLVENAVEARTELAASLSGNRCPPSAPHRLPKRPLLRLVNSGLTVSIMALHTCKLLSMHVQVGQARKHTIAQHIIISATACSWTRHWRRWRAGGGAQTVHM